MFLGHDLFKSLRNANAQSKVGTVFGYHVANPQTYGVIELDEYGNGVSIEKPKETK